MLSLAAAKRMSGGELDSSSILSALRSERRTWKQGAREYHEATTLDVLEIGRDSPGLKVRTEGFVMKPSGLMPEGTARVARFRMTCCAADAMPIAVVVRAAGASTLRADAWVEVRGAVERQRIAGHETTVIVVDPTVRPNDGIREIAAPQNPYI
jgi:uncharacterized repeat protein (TIGR03943 family)